MTPLAPLSGTRFQTEPRLRRAQLLQLALKLTGLCVPAYILPCVALGRPLYPVPTVTSALLIGGIALVCRLRVSWGTALIFQDSGIAFLRDSSVIGLIPRGSVQRVQRKKDTLAFRYQADGISRGKVKVIGREGFSKEDWTALGDHATRYVTPNTNA
jgi:hypothetical protein